MKATIKRTDLARSLHLMERAHPGGEKYDIGPIYVECSVAEPGQGVCQNGSVSLTRAWTDHAMGARLTIDPISVHEPGVVCVSADELSRVIDNWPANTVHLDTDEQVCHLRAETTHVQLPISHSDLPAAPELDSPASFEVDAGELCRLADWTVFAAARDPTRYAISGVLWEREDKKLTLVATDGRRLSLARCSARPVLPETPGSDSPVLPDSAKQVIVPITAMHLLWEVAFRVSRDTLGPLCVGATRHRQNGGLPERPITVSVTDDMIRLESKRCTAWANLDPATFPRYRDVIPQDSARNDKRAVVPRDKLLAAVRLVASLSDAPGGSARADDTPALCRLTFDRNVLSVESVTSQRPRAGIGEVAWQTVAIDYRGETMELMFTASYLTDALGVVTDETITVEFKDAQRPVVFSGGESGWTYVVMQRG